MHSFHTLNLTTDEIRTLEANVKTDKQTQQKRNFRRVLLSKQGGTKILNLKWLHAEACVCQCSVVVDSLLSLEDISAVER